MITLRRSISDNNFAEEQDPPDSVHPVLGEGFPAGEEVVPEPGVGDPKLVGVEQVLPDMVLVAGEEARDQVTCVGGLEPFHVLEEKVVREGLLEEGGGG